ncbi:MAG: hypothetical protein KGY80_06160 [Candidatus Thorarchaeota archaeon]|nr:hypothetical protein [Candidatus Thorarchaeota archaeon]
MPQGRTYIVQFNPDRITFPNRCPVCNKPATEEGVMLASESGKNEGFDPIRPSGITAPIHRASLIQSVSTRKFRIPTCPEHATSEGENTTNRSVAAIVNGLSIIAFLILSFNLGLTILQVMPIALWMVILWVSVMVAMLVSYRTLSPSDLQKAIQIMSYSKEASSFTVRISNEEYAREFLRSNPHSAELIENQE